LSTVLILSFPHLKLSHHRKKPEFFQKLSS
jgi:hypothetical protein